MITKISLADIKIEVEHNFESLDSSKNFFLPENEPCDFKISVDKSDIETENEKMREEMLREGKKYYPASEKSLESTAIYRKIAQKLPEKGAIVFHGSAVAVGNKAFIFSAKSGTGKTTHTNLWLNNIEGSYMVDGDKPIIRVFPDGVKVCGTLWNGKEKLGTNKIVPLKAICKISRGEKNSIEKVSFKEMLAHLIEQTYRSPDGEVLLKTLNVLKEVGEKVNFYSLSCNMEDEAALLSFREMNID